MHQRRFVFLKASVLVIQSPRLSLRTNSVSRVKAASHLYFWLHSLINTEIHENLLYFLPFHHHDISRLRWIFHDGLFLTLLLKGLLYTIQFSLFLFLWGDFLDILGCLCHVFGMESFHVIWHLSTFLAKNESSLLGGGSLRFETSITLSLTFIWVEEEMRLLLRLEEMNKSVCLLSYLRMEWYFWRSKYGTYCWVMNTKILSIITAE